MTPSKDTIKKLSPENRERAFAFQFEDNVRVLKATALISPQHFQQALESLKKQINAYERK